MTLVISVDGKPYKTVTVPVQISAVNQQGSTAKRRSVPGSTEAEYAIELIPATGQSTCNPTSTTTATASMLEANGVLAGSFRIRSTGFAEKSKVYRKTAKHIGVSLRKGPPMPGSRDSSFKRRMDGTVERR